MTRFARAKGSKSSNEKKPEEATSWSEMRNSILSKKAKQPEKPAAKEEVKIEAPRETEWAPLGNDDSHETASMLKPGAGKKNKNKNSSNEGVKVKKKKVSDNVGNELNLSGGDESVKKKKIKKQKESTLEGVPDINEKRVGKKAKKTKAAEDVGSECTEPKKKKKCLQIEEESVEVNGKQMHHEDSKKFHKLKKNVKRRNEKYLNAGEGSKQFNKFKGNKKFRNKSFNGNSAVEELVINGEKIQIVKFQGFYVTLDDAERLKKLRSEMIKQGIPKEKLEAAIKLERRRAEKALSRLKKMVCFHCRGYGHLLSNCPNLTEKENTGTGICYKCGSTEHSAAECKVVKGTDFKFAECFICKEQGHIARQCPDNPRGLYPQGGACRECGDVTHLRRDCPRVQAQKAEEVVTVELRNDRNLECLDEEIASREKRLSETKVKRHSVIKF